MITKMIIVKNNLRWLFIFPLIRYSSFAYSIMVLNYKHPR